MFLFRLSPCVNLFYCLLLFNNPMGSIHIEDTAVIGISPRQIKARTWKHRVYNKWAFLSPSSFIKVRIPSGVFGVTSLALYASAPNHVFGQMLGLPGSCVLLPYVPYHRLTWHQENYCDCAPVRLGEHLSRESQKLTVMI